MGGEVPPGRMALFSRAELISATPRRAVRSSFARGRANVTAFRLYHIDLN
jgi:hypothetical protein